MSLLPRGINGVFPPDGRVDRGRRDKWSIRGRIGAIEKDDKDRYKGGRARRE